MHRPTILLLLSLLLFGTPLLLILSHPLLSHPFPSLFRRQTSLKCPNCPAPDQLPWDPSPDYTYSEHTDPYGCGPQGEGCPLDDDATPNLSGSPINEEWVRRYCWGEERFRGGRRVLDAANVAPVGLTFGFIIPGLSCWFKNQPDKYGPWRKRDLGNGFQRWRDREGRILRGKKVPLIRTFGGGKGGEEAVQGQGD